MAKPEFLSQEELGRGFSYNQKAILQINGKETK